MFLGQMAREREAPRSSVRSSFLKGSLFSCELTALLGMAGECVSRKLLGFWPCAGASRLLMGQGVGRGRGHASDVPL